MMRMVAFGCSMLMFFVVELLFKFVYFEMFEALLKGMNCL